jgi:hypothetical protein
VGGDEKMSIYDDLPPVKPEISRVWQALIANTVDAFNDELFVRIPAFDEKLRWGPCRWNQRYWVEETVTPTSPGGTPSHTHNVTLVHNLRPLYPHRDDEALVIWDNDRELWVICWWPKNMKASGNRV